MAMLLPTRIGTVKGLETAIKVDGLIAGLRAIIEAGRMSEERRAQYMTAIARATLEAQGIDHS